MRKFHDAQQIGNKCALLKLAIVFAARTSLMPADEYSKYFRFQPAAGAVFLAEGVCREA
jgi:hypothetical protein